MEERLHKSTSSRMIAGVCGGLGEYFDVDATLVRLLFILLTFFSGIGVIAYIVLWIAMPEAGRENLAPRDVIRENLKNARSRASASLDPSAETGETVTSADPEDMAAGTTGETIAGGTTGEATPRITSRSRRDRTSIGGAILVVIGLLLLMENFHLFWWFNFGRLWPLILVGLGVYLIYDRSQHR